MRDHDLRVFDQLRETVARIHRTGRPVAAHCVTGESLTLTLAALRDVGIVPGDRIEHASVVPPGVATWITTLGLGVVTRPGFPRPRGDDSLRDVDVAERPFLYPLPLLGRCRRPATAPEDPALLDAVATALSAGARGWPWW